MTRKQEFLGRQQRLFFRTRYLRWRWHGAAKYGTQNRYPHGTHKTPYNPLHQGVPSKTLQIKPPNGLKHQHITFIPGFYTLHIRKAKYRTLPMPYVTPPILMNGGNRHFTYAFIPYYNRMKCRLGRSTVKYDKIKVQASAAWGMYHFNGRHSGLYMWPDWDPYHRTPVLPPMP